VTGSLDATVGLWKLSTGEVTILPYHHAEVRALHFSNSNHTLITGGKDKRVIKVDLHSSKYVDSIYCDSEVTHIKLHHDSRLLVKEKN
jgi:WD40 repeat protein